MFSTIKLIQENCRKKLIILILIFPLKVMLPFINLKIFQLILNDIQNKTIDNIILILLGYLMLMGLDKFINEEFKYILNEMDLEMTNCLNIKLIDKIINLDLSDFENSETYNKIHESLRDINTPFEVFNLIVAFIEGLLGLLISCFILASWDRFSLIFLGIAPLISFYFTIKIGKHEFKNLQERVPIVRKITYIRSLLVNDVSSKENKILGVENFFKKIFIREYEDFIKKDKEILRFQFENGILFQFLSILVAFIIIYRIINSVILGMVLFGTANTLISCVWNVTRYSEQISINIAKIYTKRNYLENLNDFIENSYGSQKEDLEYAYRNVRAIDTIEFKNVSFKYKDNLNYVLKDISFKIKRGEKIILVGENGSGKSTILKLLLGIYKKFEGEILVNGISIREIYMPSFYQRTGVIFQNFTKYELRILEFLKLSNLDISKDEVLRVLDIFESKNLLKFLSGKDIESLQLGNRFDLGVDLSGGEWQQLVFCRTLMRKNMNLLVLDEPNSGLDVLSEKRIYDILDEQLDGVTKVIVTHRLQLIDLQGYRIIYIEDGRICEDDNSEKLLLKNTKFKDFYENSKTGDEKND
ncbi:TPA: ABC transporter ATP-binding protein [Streptococcus agalactiae]|nr:ABC transporter ATP-binding protein [Streptococcus agalactiae]